MILSILSFIFTNIHMILSFMTPEILYELIMSSSVEWFFVEKIWFCANVNAKFLPLTHQKFISTFDYNGIIYLEICGICS